MSNQNPTLPAEDLGAKDPEERDRILSILEQFSPTQVRKTEIEVEDIPVAVSKEDKDFEIYLYSVFCNRKS